MMYSGCAYTYHTWNEYDIYTCVLMALNSNFPVISRLRKTHPGPVVHLSDMPNDSTKVNIDLTKWSSSLREAKLETIQLYLKWNYSKNPSGRKIVLSSKRYSGTVVPVFKTTNGTKKCGLILQVVLK